MCLRKFAAGIMMVTMSAVVGAMYTGHVLKLPVECENETVCAPKPTFYDDIQQEIEMAFAPIRKKFDLKNIVRGDEEQEKSVYSEDSCSYITKVVTPYTLKMNNNKTLFVVQSSLYKQHFSITMCEPQYDMENGDACFTQFFRGWSNWYCKNRYGKNTIFVYDVDKKIIERVAISIPIACDCIKKDQV